MKIYLIAIFENLEQKNVKTYGARSHVLILFLDRMLLLIFISKNLHGLGKQINW